MTENNLTIRKAKPDEGGQIMLFQMAMAQETEGITLDSQTLEAGVKAVFERPELGCYYMAELNGHIIASLLITYEWSDWRNSLVWWIQSVYVKPEHRKCGVFSGMYHHIKSLVMEREDVKGLRLYMVSENENAGRVYKKLGMDGDKYRMFEWMK